MLSSTLQQKILHGICINETVDGLRSEPVFDETFGCRLRAVYLRKKLIHALILLCFRAKIFHFLVFVIIIRKELLEKDDRCHEFASDIAICCLTSKLLHRL